MPLDDDYYLFRCFTSVFGIELKTVGHCFEFWKQTGMSFEAIGLYFIDHSIEEICTIIIVFLEHFYFHTLAIVLPSFQEYFFQSRTSSSHKESSNVWLTAWWMKWSNQSNNLFIPSKPDSLCIYRKREWVRRVEECQLRSFSSSYKKIPNIEYNNTRTCIDEYTMRLRQSLHTLRKKKAYGTASFSSTMCAHSLWIARPRKPECTPIEQTAILTLPIVRYFRCSVVSYIFFFIFYTPRLNATLFPW